MSGDPFGVSVFLGISFRLAGLAALELPLQEGLDKGEQASIENSLGQFSELTGLDPTGGNLLYIQPTTPETGNVLDKFNYTETIGMHCR